MDLLLFDQLKAPSKILLSSGLLGGLGGIRET